MKKKLNYESPGLVRRLLKKGASFKSLGGGESLADSSTNSTFRRFGNSEGKQWRPRKNQFELLDGNDDDSLSVSFQYDSSSTWNIQNALSSAESETGDYRRGIMFEQKATALKKTPVKMRCMDKKRGLSPIKPPCKDTSAIRAPTSSAKKALQKREIHDIEWDGNNQQNDLNFCMSNLTSASDDPFFTPQTDSFGFETHEKNIHPLSSHNTVVSDPTDFFSKEQTTKLTIGNLAKMDYDPKTISSTTKKNFGTRGGIEKLVKERKFYQFAIDEDRASTVVESTIQLPADYPGGDYSIDDDTEMSCGETSQGTRIQQRSVTSEREQISTERNSGFFSKDTKVIPTCETARDILATSSHSRKHAIEVKEFDAFFPRDTGKEKGEEKKNDGFFPPSIDEDNLFPSFGGKTETQYLPPPPPETEISSFGGDNYFDHSHTPANNTLGQASTKSLAYSVSPIHKQKSTAAAVAAVPQNGRQPLTSKNSLASSGKKNKPFQANTVPQKSDKGNDWYASKNIREQEAQFQFDEFPARLSSLKKKRHSSISSSNFQPPPSDPFESSPNKFGAKENFAVNSNRNENLDDGWGVNQNKQPPRAFQRDQYMLQKNLGDDDTDSDSDENEDIFDDVGNWERPAPTSIGRGVMIASQNRTNVINRARLARHSNESFNRPSRNQYIDDYNDDARSASGFEVSRASIGSRTKPLALPSNAIMASMLFQTQQYDIDQNDVEEKINAIEQENLRQKRIRTSQGGIPDAVNADDDYMTTVSSFSDATSAYMQESWRKPSRDLLNHFSSAHALDMNYRRLPVRARPEPKPQRHLYEA